MTERESNPEPSVPRTLRKPKQHTRKEIQRCKPDVKRLMAFGTEDDLMRFLRGIGIFDEDPRFASAVSAFRLLKRGKL
jgi:hypothetical protein